MALLGHQAITALDGVGPKLAEKLGQLSIYTIEDLLFHFPLRYQDRTRVYPIVDLRAGTAASVVADVVSSQVVFGRKRQLVIHLHDGSGKLELRFFYFNAAMKQTYETGQRVWVYGDVKAGKNGPVMIHPELKPLASNSDINVDETLTPIYPTTEGVHQLTLRKLIDQALFYLQTHKVAELFDSRLSGINVDLKQALQIIHRPPADVSVEELEQARHPAQRRLILEELAAHQLSLIETRAARQGTKTLVISHQCQLLSRFLDNLPFQPTNAQRRVIDEIRTDLSGNHPMMRLVQGDVGSGKTLVAASAMLLVVEAGYQVALLAPTEILAEQHAMNLSAWFSSLDVSVALLTGKQRVASKRQALADIASGRTAVIIGTHAIFQESVDYHQLGLVVIDEQHKFGVHQRLTLQAKGVSANAEPHQLIMTATPIPRTLAMASYADLDTSIIDELPKGRQPITTTVLPNSKREQVIERVEQMICEHGHQAYWVCTLVEESDQLQLEAAEATFIALQQRLVNLSVGLVHGRMKPDEKQAIMAQFKSGDIDLLVATTVIEVGVDVPNATVMVIENPERLGLAQLHQLRGRVGRGSSASYCLLMYQTPLSKTATKRLGVLRESQDGFFIAEQDLQIRGPGELLGTRQTGIAQLKVADLGRDHELIEVANKAAHEIEQHYPERIKPLIERWIADRVEYSRA